MESFNELWWWPHLADMLSLIMAGSLVIMSIILYRWPGPKTWARWGAVVSGVIAAVVLFVHIAFVRINPHPRVSLSFFMFFLAASMLKYRATAEARSDVYHHRRSDDLD